MPMTSVYGVSDEEVRWFIGDFEIVRAWLGKYSGESRFGMAHDLCRFFKWLKVVKDIDTSPKELLNEQISLRGSTDIGKRQKNSLQTRRIK